MPVDAKVGGALQGNKVFSPAVLLALALSTAVTGACRGREVDRGAARQASTLAEVVQPAFLARALRQVGGAHFHGVTRFSVARAGGAPIAVATTTEVWVDRAGNYRLREENDRDGGREVVLYGRELSVALRYGRMIRRVAEEPEPSRLLAEALGGPAAAFELVAPRARLTPAGTELVGGANATVFLLALGDGAARPATSGGSFSGLRAWRGAASIEALTGRMVVDDVSGALVRADLTASFQATGQAGPEHGTVDVHTLLTDIASTPPIERPAAEELVLRQRTVPEARELLRGLAERRAVAEPLRRPSGAGREAQP
jgi:hypothetical protein